MLDIIAKQEYFSWLDRGVADPKDYTLKGIQDAWVLSVLQDKENLAIVEVGGGNSRVLKKTSKQNECWNIDKLEGYGLGPTSVSDISNVKLIRSYVGEFDPEIPSDYFDVLFSISVVEHIPKPNIQDFFADCYRILKPGGVMLHAIDLYIFDDPADMPRLIDMYREAVEACSFEWLAIPKVSGHATFKCGYASNADITLNQWNRSAPALKSIRAVAQSVTIKLVAFKPLQGEDDGKKKSWFMVTDSDSGSALNLSDSPELDGSTPSSLPQPAVSRPEHVRLKPRAEAISQPPSLQQLSSLPSAPAKGSIPEFDNAKTEAKSIRNRSIGRSVPVPAEESSKPYIQRVKALAEGVISYYSRWPALVAIGAIFLSITAFSLDAPFSQGVAAMGIVLLLLLVGHAASKADYVLKELESERTNRRKATSSLKKKVETLSRIVKS